jgi:phosphopantothenoylcysteine decarboxylase/phosphopantothenate--cysteine ligase
MRVLVTAGGTREPIDAVRVIANTSTGRLGAHLATAAAAAGHDVLLLAAESAERAGGVRTLGFETSADLARLLEEHAPRADAVLHAAAVSDYVPVPVAGKIPSDEPELLLRLARAPKLVDRLRGLCPRGFLVGFKLTSGAGPSAQVAAAQVLLRRARLDLVVVNDAGRTGSEDHEALLVDASGPQASVRGKAAIAAALVARLPAVQDHGAAAR